MDAWLSIVTAVNLLHIRASLMSGRVNNFLLKNKLNVILSLIISK
jgi:hypothetical protein